MVFANFRCRDYESFQSSYLNEGNRFKNRVQSNDRCVQSQDDPFVLREFRRENRHSIAAVSGPVDASVGEWPSVASVLVRIHAIRNHPN